MTSNKSHHAPATGHQTRPPNNRIIPPVNIINDFNKFQGVYHPSELGHRIPRDIGTKQISLDNASDRYVAIAITTYKHGPIPQTQFIMIPREIRYIGVNPPDMYDQFIWMMDTVTGKPLGPAYIVDRMSNQFVIRPGINMFQIVRYRQANMTAAH